MAHVLGTVLTLGLLLFSVFQPVLYHNAATTQETIKISLYEVQKEAALIGHFNEELYGEFKSMLVQNHGYNPACIQIEGTEQPVSRGEDITVSVTIPKPMMNIWEAFDFASCDRPDSYIPYTVQQVIKSEYIP
ncbi:hypothetical protein [Planomicrobium okeanokoites]|uniref:hypothetical protein n=1 Tax=Planomicrobium okeanokoites TaxID=244 RepID=UPI00249073F3|nr:hypothetical protein [Planomicrobium okeanokoites]